MNLTHICDMIYTILVNIQISNTPGNFNSAALKTLAELVEKNT